MSSTMAHSRGNRPRIVLFVGIKRLVITKKYLPAYHRVVSAPLFIIGVYLTTARCVR